MQVAEEIFKRANLQYITDCLQDEQKREIGIKKAYDERLIEVV